MDPDTIVAVVAQNTRLNTNVEASVNDPSAPSAINPPKFVNRSQLGIPIRPPKASVPIIREYPSNENTTVPIQKSIRFFIMMFPAFFALVNPVSTIANPACIQNTSAAPIKNQNSIVIIILSPSSLLYYYQQTPNKSSPYVGNGQYSSPTAISASSQATRSSLIV